MGDYQDRKDIDDLLKAVDSLRYVSRMEDETKLLATLDELNAVVSDINEKYYDKSEVYNKDEVYNKKETYDKLKLYTKSEVYTKDEVIDEINHRAYHHPPTLQCLPDDVDIGTSDRIKNYLATKGYPSSVTNTTEQVLYLLVKQVFP